MGVHVYGTKPLYLLERARPREDGDVKTYRIENYEPTTKAGSDKSLDIVSKIFNPTLYSIRWNEEGNKSNIEELKKYTLDFYPEYNSLMSFNKDVVLRKMIADPNGILAVKPLEIPENDATRLKPITVVYGSNNIWFRDRDHYLIFIKEERQDLTIKSFFEYYDRNLYVEFSAYHDGPSDRVIVEEVFRYTHSFGEIPVWTLRGKSKDLDNGWIIYESFFSSALPHWNLAIIHESDLLGAYITHMHPQKYELAEECSYQFKWEGVGYQCQNGIISYPAKDGQYTKIDCPHCLGTGLTTVKSPYGVYQYTKSKLDMTESRSLQPVGYISIPVDATKMLEERTEKMIQKGMWSINMDIEEKVGENQSGVAKVIDRSAQHDTLYNISTVMYDVHVNNEYYFINKYMFGVEATSAREEEDLNLPQVNKPVVFDIATVSELVNNFKVAKESGLDRNFLRVREIEILSRDMSTNPDLKNYLIALLSLDPLPLLSVDEINSIIDKTVTREDAIIHFNLKKFVDRAVNEVKGFLDKDKEGQYEKLLEYAKEVADQTKVELDENMLDETGNPGNEN